MMSPNFKIKAKNRLFDGLTKEKEGHWKGPFFFINASDTQFGMIESFLEKKPNPKWDKEIALTKQAIAAVNQMKPKPRFFVVCGDLVDAFPGTSLRKPQEEDFKKVFSELSPEVPLVCICGNHDMGNQPTRESVQGFRDVFGDDYFVFWCGGVMCIVLNSQFYEDPSLVQDLAKEQDTWLDHQLDEAKSGGYRHVVVFQHIPWFLKDLDEKKVIFNIQRDVRKKMLEKFHKAGVRAIFCGHYHRNGGAFYKDTELIITSAIGAQLGKDKHGLRVVRVLDDAIHHKYYELKDIPKHVPVQ